MRRRPRRTAADRRRRNRPRRACRTWRISGARRRTCIGRSRFCSMEAPVRRRYGCTWVRSVPNGCSPPTTGIVPRRHTAWSTTNTHSSMPATWCSSMRPARASGICAVRTRRRRFSAWIRTRMRLRTSSWNSSPGTAVGTRRNICSAKATEPRVRRCWPTSCKVKNRWT